jgi:hypothetical protein
MERFEKKLKVDSLFKRALKARKNEKYDKYVSILKEGLEKGNPECIYLLAECYSSGYCGIKEDSEQSLLLHEQNIAYPKSLCILSTRTERNFSNQFKEILNSSGNHYAKGYYYYYNTTEVEKAFSEFLKSAEEGDDKAQEFVALCLDCGIGTNQDEKKAYGWYFKAAEQGNPHCMHMLMYYYGSYGIIKDHEKEMFWCKRYFKISGDCNFLSHYLEINEDKLKIHNIDFLVNVYLARCYLSGEEVQEKNEYVSWYFYKQSNEKKELKKFEETVFKKFVRCYKLLLTLLCIGKFSKHPKEVFIMIGKELWKTKNDKEWEY